jgi:hypothetical protein
MKQSVSVMKKKADAIFSIYVRTRDADQDGLVPCITCKAKRPIKEMQNGHFVKRSVNSLRFDEENCNAQCPGCNVFRYGEQYLYALAIDDKYGDGTADRLMQQRFSTHKFTVQELQEIIDYAKQGIADRE